MLVALLLLWVGFGPLVLVAAVGLLCVPRLRWWVQDRFHVSRRMVAYALGGVLVVTGVVVLIPDGWLPIPQAPGILAAPSYSGRPATPKPIEASAVPSHPYLARNGANSMHNDAAGSDAYSWPGPTGLQPEVETAWFGIQECATMAFDSHDRLIAMCGDTSGPSLHVVDPDTMRKVADKALPQRAESDKAPWEDLCGGAYFYLDERDRAVLATTDRQVLAVDTSDGNGDPELSTDQSWDLKPYVPFGDCLIALLPDVTGHIWWVSQDGLVGTITPESGQIRVHDLGEGIFNSFVTDENGGVFVVSDTALYRLVAGPGGTPEVTWQLTYDRGREQKPGQLSQGSGTTPTLLDDGVIAITDNAEPRMNVVFVNKGTGKEICKQPVFEDDASATDNSLVSLGSSVVVENNHGYSSPLSTILGFATSPGLARVDLADGKCSVRWTSDRVAPTSVAKVSWANGLIYAYTKRPSWSGVSSWYVTALDAETGRAMWSVRTGTGALMNNHYAAITIAPDSSLWIATLAGLVRVRDRPQD